MSPRLPAPQYVMTGEGTRIATYSWGDDSAPVAVLVHGFASSAQDNWVDTGWVNDLLAADLRVLALDLRGHGHSDKSHEVGDYSMRILANDVETVLDTYLVDSAVYLGYSFGARLGWDILRDLPHRIDRAVLGGFPFRFALPDLDLAAVGQHIAEDAPVGRDVERNYFRLTERLHDNDQRALLAFSLGARSALKTDVDVAEKPSQPVLFATGSRDSLLAGAREITTLLPDSPLIEIPDRHHFNAPGSAVFRKAGVEFLRS